MEAKTIKEKRANTLDEIDTAKMEVEYMQLQLEKNLEYINEILLRKRKTKKIISYLIYLKLNWINDNYNENQLKLAEKRLKDFSNLYENTVLKRKLLKERLKKAQRKFSKKQKSIIRFDKKYFPEERG